MANFKEDLNFVKAFVFDVDGVMTNASVILHPSGELLRTSNMRDGYALVQAVKHGYPVAIISGGKSESVRRRFEGLGINSVYLDSKDKKADLMDFCKNNKVELKDILYMGDDIPDYEVMTMVGLPTCPYDAVPEIRDVSRYISNFKGGEGCVRDIIEQVLRLHGKWFNPNK